MLGKLLVYWMFYVFIKWMFREGCPELYDKVEKQKNEVGGKIDAFLEKYTDNNVANSVENNKHDDSYKIQIEEEQEQWQQMTLLELACEEDRRQKQLEEAYREENSWSFFDTDNDSNNWYDDDDWY